MTERNFSILWRLPALHQGSRTFNNHLTLWIFNFMFFHADHHSTEEWIEFFTSSNKIIFLLILNEWVSNMQSFLHTFTVTDIREKKFLSNPLKSTNQNIDFLCIEKLLWFVLDIAMVGFCLDSFIITCRGRTWHFQVTKCEYTSYCF